ncbi:cardiolipin synthase [Alkalihalophilus lindianensis]|uniref:Cardiolipin synthase n=1 Tax=Alkalihalophilus lindianensis TaxID=1630542 RepID=A0ABU3XAW1_9BACI|nr:cardiolipin synthase [Alkalihalophilus lindianensis]MDV2684554.1 cardiolipin synthase [Alkalihalophilus lindianensis]
MNGMIITLVIIVLLFIWLRMDFVLGQKKQRKEATRHTQVTRYGNVNFLATGDDFFEALFADLSQAEHHIHLLFYIFKEDHIGKKALKILADKAQEGVTVRVLVDRFGCELSRKTIKQLKKKGVRFAYSHPISFPYLFFTLNRRNHRKLVIVDGRVGYIGGFNIGDEYLGRDPKFGPWRDFHLRLNGDGVQDLQEQFLEDWQTAKQKFVREEALYPSLREGPHPLRILPTDGSYLEESFISLISQAKKTITIGTPYYIPGKPLQKALIEAAKRGVDIRLILPKKGDHPFVKEAAFPYFKDLLVAGIEVYQYYRGFFHAKAIVIDTQMADVGTANFDKRSFHINHEINCLLYDQRIVQVVLDQLEHDIFTAQRMTIETFNSRPFLQRGKEKLATLISGLL